MPNLSASFTLSLTLSLNVYMYIQHSDDIEHRNLSKMDFKTEKNHFFCILIKIPPTQIVSRETLSYQSPPLLHWQTRDRYECKLLWKETSHHGVKNLCKFNLLARSIEIILSINLPSISKLSCVCDSCVTYINRVIYSIFYCFSLSLTQNKIHNFSLPFLIYFTSHFMNYFMNVVNFLGLPNKKFG